MPVLVSTGTLIAYAANGMFRGLRKANITLWSAVAGAVVNIALDALFIFGFDWGVAGSGIATGIAQWFMCAIVILYLLPIVRRNNISLKPDFGGVKDSAGDGLMLFVRTAALRVGMVATVIAATAMGTRVLASYQVINSSWNLALNVLDAIGVGGQALVGTALGAKNIKLVHSLIKEIERAGIVWGSYVGILFALLGWTGAHLFTTDSATAYIIAVCALIVGIFFPYHGWLWALDGVLIGAGDFTYLAKLCSISALAHIAALTATFYAVHQTQTSQLMQAISLWLVFNIVFMGIRGIGNIRRAHTDTWIRAAIADM
ncbi:polysaccharide biosynthesis C-terminal domain-containing protein [Alloscardovia omnicolens]|uniref:MATE family efflux transporter n=1 Tax=Alloscardovia omnicolens TaxID=419015 RepID=UPI003A6DAA48